MGPVVITTLKAFGCWRGLLLIAFEPVFDDVVIKLFGPEHPCKPLPRDLFGIRRQVLRNNRLVKFISFVLTSGEDSIEINRQQSQEQTGSGQSAANGGRLARAGSDNERLLWFPSGLDSQLVSRPEQCSR